jgi:hypothetical protein
VRQNVDSIPALPDYLTELLEVNLAAVVFFPRFSCLELGWRAEAVGPVREISKNKAPIVPVVLT